MINNPSHFVRANTALVAPPLVPEISLHTATEVVPLWRKTEEELQADGVPPPYWAFAWAGGQALARYVLDHREEVAGRRVLDFGSGSGLVAVAAAKAGASHVQAAEIDAIAAEAIALNCAANGITCFPPPLAGEERPKGAEGGSGARVNSPPPARCASLARHLPREVRGRKGEVEIIARDVIGSPRAWDMILVGDMCYERPLAERLLAWLIVMAQEGATVLLGDPGRSYFPKSGVTKLTTYSVQTTRELEDREIRETGVYRLTPDAHRDAGTVDP